MSTGKDTPMPHFNDDVSSTLTQTKLFDYMADFTNAADWDPGTKSAKRPARRMGRAPTSTTTPASI